MAEPVMHPELQEILADLADGGLSEAQIERLDSILLQSTDARRIFDEYVNVHVLLEWLHSPDNTFDGVLGEAEKVEAKVQAPRVWRENALRIVRFISRPTPLSMTLAALILVQVIALMAFVSVPMYQQWTNGEKGAIPEDRIVGKLVRLHHEVWEAGQPPLGSDANLVAHQRIALHAGLLEVELVDGATLTLEGPLQLIVNEGGLVTLLEGKLVARVPQRAKGFTVSSPRGSLVDLGTEFGVEVADENVVATVFEGEVEFIPNDNASSTAKRTLLRSGESLRVSPQGTNVAPATDEVKHAFARKVPPPQFSILFDFGLTEHATAVDQHTHWNNVAGLSRDDLFGDVVNSAVDSAGNPTSIQLSIDDPGEGMRRFIGDYDRPGVRIKSPTGIQYPESATRDVAAVYGGAGFSPRRVLKISGCEAGTSYDLVLFASTERLDRTSEFEIGGVTQKLPTLNNKNRFVRFTDVTPVNGVIEIEFRAAERRQIANLATLELVPYAHTSKD